MTVLSRWRGEISLRPYDTPDKQAALPFALYGLRAEVAEDHPGPTVAVVTIADQHGTALGSLHLDTNDVERLTAALGDASDAAFGPWNKQEVQRALDSR